MSWVDEALAFPIAFAQVREDPLLDRQVIESIGRPARVVMVASGGCTAAYLASLPSVRSLHLVDPNPSQLALARLKLSLLRESPGHRALLLGHDPHWMPPGNLYDALRRAAHDAGIDVSALAPKSAIAKYGLDRCGRYECVFEELRRSLSRDGMDGTIESLRVNTDLSRQQTLVASGGFRAALTRACESAFETTALVRLFGTAAVASSRMPFSRHFDERIQGALKRFLFCSNPWLVTVLAGTSPHGALGYPWLSVPVVGRLPTIEASGGMMQDVLRDLPAESADLIHLSNICDWLPADSAGELLDAAARVLAPGGAVILRQLNSSLDVPTAGAAIAWDAARGAELLERDRSYFYRAVHVGSARA